MKPVCEHEKETFYHFSSTHSSHCTESLSCNLFCRFLHHHYSRWCSFMSDSDGAATTTEGNPWLTLDGNVRITQARQQRNNINENVFFPQLSFFRCAVHRAMSPLVWGFWTPKPKQTTVFLLAPHSGDSNYRRLFRRMFSRNETCMRSHLKRYIRIESIFGLFFVAVADDVKSSPTKELQRTVKIIN